MARGTFEYKADKKDNWYRKTAPRYVRAIQAIQSLGKTVNDPHCEIMDDKVDKIEETLYAEVERVVTALRAGKYDVAVAGL